MKFSITLVHIGYHKTGSNWFHKLLFCRQDLGFLTSTREEPIEEVALVNAFSFNPHLARKKLK